jgi:hypothetical protein
MLASGGPVRRRAAWIVSSTRNRISVRPGAGSLSVARAGHARGLVIIIIILVFFIVFVAVAAQRAGQAVSRRAFAASEATLPVGALDAVREVYAVCDSGCGAACYDGGAG